MRIRKTAEGDIPAVLEIIEEARAYFRQAGIPQWQGSYPDIGTIREDIRNGTGYVAVDWETVVGFCAMIDGGEPDYETIEGGAWRNDRPYLTVHRLGVRASRKGTGVGAALFREAARLSLSRGIRDIRCDTHRKNGNMQRLVTKCGFCYCGIIHLRSDGSERLAYHWILDETEGGTDH